MLYFLLWMMWGSSKNLYEKITYMEVIFIVN